MSKYPSIRAVQSVIDDAKSCSAGIKTPNGVKYVPARSLGYPSFTNRCKAAWLVFTGKADALIYEGQ